MNITTFNAPIIVSKVETHKRIKESVVQAIDAMGRFSYTLGAFPHGQRVTHTDWHLGASAKRKYWDIAGPHVEEVLSKMCSVLSFRRHEVLNYWFQWYEKNDYHALHLHGGCMFSGVYYVQLDETSPKTRFNVNGQAFEVEVSEGDIIIFPCFLAHESVANTNKTPKIVIAFNLNFFGVQNG